MKKYLAIFRYGGNKYWSQALEAKSANHAKVLAQTYLKAENKGCDKSERSIFIEIQLLQEKPIK